jgi:hypothetical protein
MNNVVWKYVIQPNAVVNGAYTIEIPNVPINAEPLSVGVQNGEVCVWMKVNPNNPKIGTTKLWCVGTGWGTIENLYYSRFLGTVINGAYVWHLWY